MSVTTRSAVWLSRAGPPKIRFTRRFFPFPCFLSIGERKTVDTTTTTHEEEYDIGTTTKEARIKAFRAKNARRKLLTDPVKRQVNKELGRRLSVKRCNKEKFIEVQTEYLRKREERLTKNKKTVDKKDDGDGSSQ